jgi:hypothetical protein
MKTYNNLYTNFISFSNFYKAFKKSRKAKPYNYYTLSFEFFLEKEIFKLINDLKTNRYSITNKDYNIFIIYEPKKRIIKSLSFKHKLVQYSLYNVLKPIFERSFIYHSYACRENKGVHKCVLNIKNIIKNNNNLYCLKCDIKKYFQSVDHNILKRIIFKKIKDKKIRALLDKIIDSDNSQFGKDKGIPIGNLTSQLFANIYLNEIDQYIKHNLKVKYYFRYMDDFIILDSSKKELHRYKYKIKKYLKKYLKLELPSKKTSIFPVNNGINFLGYIIYPKYIRIRKKNYKNFIKRTKKKKHKELKINRLESSICSYLGYCKIANTFSFNYKIFKEYFEDYFYLFFKFYYICE